MRYKYFLFSLSIFTVGFYINKLKLHYLTSFLTYLSCSYVLLPKVILWKNIYKFLTNNVGETGRATMCTIVGWSDVEQGREWLTSGFSYFMWYKNRNIMSVSKIQISYEVKICSLKKNFSVRFFYGFIGMDGYI